MDINKVFDEITTGNDGILLDKLKSYSFDSLSKEFKNYLLILLVLTEKGNDQIGAQQLLRNSIISLLSNNKIDNISLSQKILNIIQENATSPYVNTTSMLSRVILDCIDNSIITENKSIGDFFDKKDILNVNVLLLSKAINEQLDFESIISIFYGCISDMELPERKVLLAPQAISIFKNYIEENPKDYLIHFIRPYYTMYNTEAPEYFLNVPEPFYLRIFKTNNEFISFLEGIKDIDNILIEDIKAFIFKYDESKKKGGDAVYIGKNFRLLSKEHTAARHPDK